jgi:hypothetical protein
MFLEGRTGNRCDEDYALVVNKVIKLKLNKPALFTRMYRLSPKAFDEVLFAIQADLMPKKMTAKYFVPPHDQAVYCIVFSCWQFLPRYKLCL